ncbi:conserved hypothetical protein [Coccidioides posadasii str. Silveira]|uniref:Uncharacterized protein n=1 Tax=Coccidioides posadasii (strain RMSCC 757 / Silveira) TaxID=443226 RepID=E9DDT0_COCPS|nr:conserved hypothetical protein [Coccidioides posadasii str. Silveira]
MESITEETHSRCAKSPCRDDTSLLQLTGLRLCEPAAVGIPAPLPLAWFSGIERPPPLFRPHSLHNLDIYPCRYNVYACIFTPDGSRRCSSCSQNTNHTIHAETRRGGCARQNRYVDKQSKSQECNWMRKDNPSYSHSARNYRDFNSILPGLNPTREQARRHEGPKTHDDVILQRPEGLASPKRHSQQMRDFKSRPSHHGVRHRCCHQNCIIVPAIDGR